MTGPRRAVQLLLDANRLEQVDRTGFVMCGVERPETVAAHTAGMAVACLLIADGVGEDVDRGRMLTMALLHDLGEIRVGDVPLIEKTEEDERREEAALRELLGGLPEGYLEIMEEYRAGETLEARIVEAADKLQLMAKVLAYQDDENGKLDSFWKNLANFNDAGLPAARELYDELRRRHHDRKTP